MTAYLMAGLVMLAMLVRPRQVRIHRIVPRRGDGRYPDDGRYPALASPGAEGERPWAAATCDLPAVVVADLMVALLEAGLPVETALALLAEQAGRLPWSRLGPFGGAAESAEPAGSTGSAGSAGSTGSDPILEALDLATGTGIAPAALVRAAAAEHRRREAAAHAAAASRLGVMAVLPMGLCLLPAFVLLTVVPLVLGLIGDL